MSIDDMASMWAVANEQELGFKETKTNTMGGRGGIKYDNEIQYGSLIENS